jgi:putative transposase
MAKHQSGFLSQRTEVLEMLAFGLFEGMYLRLRNREFIINQRLPSGDLQIKDTITEEFTALCESDLLAAFAQGELVFLGDKASTAAARRMEETFVSDITALESSNKSAAEMHRRHKYIQALVALTPTDRQNNRPVPPSVNECKRLIKEVHIGFRDSKKAPHWKTVYYEWLPPFLESGEDIRSLMPDYQGRGNRNRKFSGSRKTEYSDKDLDQANKVAEIVDEVIRSEYLTLQRLSVSAVHETLEVRIDRENRTRDQDEQLPVPSVNSLYYIISRLDRYEVCRGRYGKRIADLKFKAYIKGIVTSRVLQRDEVDSTKLDLMVIDDETFLPIGRPTFTLDLDKYSNMLMGFYVSFDGEGALAILRCLRHAILPKNYVKEEFPEIRNTWEAYGLPELLVIDNGPGQHSKHLDDACNQLGIDTEFCPVRQPWFKAAIERYIRTNNQLLVHSLPGTTFSDLFDKNDYDPKKYAIITLKTLLLIIHKFVIDYYQFRRPKNAKGSPHLLWKESAKKYRPNLPQKADDLTILLGHIEYRTIQHYGIELHGIFYNDPQLAQLRRNGRIALHHKHTVKWDPLDLNIIHVLHPLTKKYLVIPSTNPAYTSGLTFYQHKVTRRFLRKRDRDDKNEMQLALAKEEIREIVTREWKKLKKTGPRTRAARLKQISQPDYETSHGKEEGTSSGKSSSTSVPLWSTNPKLSGISNFQNPAEATQPPAELAPVTDVTVIEVAARKKNRKSRIAEAKAKPASVQAISSQVAEANGNGMERDDDLDLNAWKADTLSKGRTT